MVWVIGSVCPSRSKELVDLPFFLLDLEGEILLGNIAETNNDHGRQHLGDRGINVELFDEQLDEDDVQPDADHHQHEIPEQLYPTMQRAARKSDMPVQKETGGKAYTKSDKDRSNRRRDGLREPMEIDMDIVLMQDIVEAEPVHHNIHHRARPAARGIPEGL